MFSSGAFPDALQLGRAHCDSGNRHSKEAGRQQHYLHCQSTPSYVHYNNASEPETFMAVEVFATLCNKADDYILFLLSCILFKALLTPRDVQSSLTANF